MSGIKYVYIAGPYDGNSQGSERDRNVYAALEVADTLISAGFVPFVPHLSHYWHARFPRSRDDWLWHGQQWVHRCDAVLRLPGASAGADAEVAMAERQSIPVFVRIKDIIAQSISGNIEGLDNWDMQNV